MTAHPPAPGAGDGREQALADRLRQLSEPAPAHLHRRVAELTASSGSPGPRRRRRARLTLAGAVAAAAVAILLAGQSRRAPEVPALARFALAAASGPRPAPDPGRPGRLRAHVGAVAFPRWGAGVGFSATGVRTARLGGRQVVAVAYRSAAGDEVGYAIAAVPPLATGPGVVRTIVGVRYVVGRAGDTTTVTWRRDGHTCVLASRAVPAATLLALAAGRDTAY